GPADQHINTTPAIHDVVTVATVEIIIAALTELGVVTVIPDLDDPPLGSNQNIVAAPAIGCRTVTIREINPVVAGIALLQIYASVAHHRVTARAPVRRIVAAPVVYNIVGIAAKQQIVTAATDQHIVWRGRRWAERRR